MELGVCDQKSGDYWNWNMTVKLCIGNCRTEPPCL